MEKKITALTLQKKNRQRINVYLNDEFAFGLSYIVATWLKVGQILEDEKIIQLLRDDEIEVAYQRALKFLAYRIRSEHEVVQRLRKYKSSSDAIDEVMFRLREKEYINDKEFAQTWVENRIEFQPRSTYMLRQELRKKGIADYIIENILQGLDDEKLASCAAEKQIRKFKHLQIEEEFRKKMYGYLARKGFTYAITAEIINNLWQDLQNNKDNN